MNPARRGQPAGFTLMEVLVSTAILGILLVAVGSAMLIAARAMPGQDNTNQNALAAVRTLESMTSELCEAITVPEFTAAAITVTVPDRPGDGNSNPDTIRYAWSGTPGDPVTRQYNGGRAAVLLEGVHHFAVDGDLKEVVSEGGTTQESGAQLLVSHQPTGGTVVHRILEPFKWPGQFFRPVLPPATVGWRITRICYQGMRAGLPDGQVMLAVVTVGPDCLPTSTVLGWTVLDEINLPLAYGWGQFTLAAAPMLEPEAGAALLVCHSGGGPAGWIRYEAGGVDTPGAHGVHSTDRGATWDCDTGIDMVFEIYGKVTTTDAASRYYLKFGRLALQTGGDPTARVETAFPVYNQPQVPGPIAGGP